VTLSEDPVESYVRDSILPKEKTSDGVGPNIGYFFAKGGGTYPARHLFLLVKSIKIVVFTLPCLALCFSCRAVYLPLTSPNGNIFQDEEFS
jgi:hypothetical protein